MAAQADEETMVVLVASVPRRRLQLRRIGSVESPVGFLRADAAELFAVVVALATAVGR
jgi:hypothetical protein